MQLSPVLLLHICSGTVGFLSGAVTIFLRKGSRRHSVLGNVFVVSMLGLGLTGAYMALMKQQPGNFLGGTLTIYLVGTAWLTARHWNEGPGILDWSALLVGLMAIAGYVIYGLKATQSPKGLDGVPAGIYFFMGSVVMLAVVGDIRVLLRGGINGTARLARHLWRMCFALFIAAGSIFLARAHLFPVVLRKTGVLFLLSFGPLLLMIFWLVRVRLMNRRKKNSLPSGVAAYSVRA
jgi:hypothetical protein